MIRALVLGLFVCSVLGAAPVTPVASDLQEKDVNDDDISGETEAESEIEFKELDKNGDGYVDASEVMHSLEPSELGTFYGYDEDGNNMLSKAEFLEYYRDEAEIEDEEDEDEEDPDDDNGEEKETDSAEKGVGTLDTKVRAGQVRKTAQEKKEETEEEGDKTAGTKSPVRRAKRNAVDAETLNEETGKQKENIDENNEAMHTRLSKEEKAHRKENKGPVRRESQQAEPTGRPRPKFEHVKVTTENEYARVTTERPKSAQASVHAPKGETGVLAGEGVWHSSDVSADVVKKNVRVRERKHAGTSSGSQADVQEHRVATHTHKKKNSRSQGGHARSQGRHARSQGSHAHSQGGHAGTQARRKGYNEGTRRYRKHTKSSSRHHKVKTDVVEDGEVDSFSSHHNQHKKSSSRHHKVKKDVFEDGEGDSFSSPQHKVKKDVVEDDEADGFSSPYHKVNKKRR